MRLVGSLSNENLAHRLSSYLLRKGIDSKCEGSFDVKTGQMSYALWILDEDKIAVAESAFSAFQKEPSNLEFDSEEILSVEEVQGNVSEAPFLPKPQRSPLSFVILFLCLAIFFFNGFQEASMETPSSMTPIVGALLYDIPAKEMGGGYWQGIANWVLMSIKDPNFSPELSSLFFKIRQGEVWRLFSPSVLHTELLHILFNMSWLWILSRPIEQRVGSLRLGVLTLVAGIGSNTMQYLISGPFFLGYSGVVLALAGFIWARQKKAPWEGYSLHRTTLWFLMVFVGAMFALSITSFVLELFSVASFAPNIANMAHIFGFFIGTWLGRFSFFAQRGVLR